MLIPQIGIVILCSAFPGKNADAIDRKVESLILDTNAGRFMIKTEQWQTIGVSIDSSSAGQLPSLEIKLGTANESIIIDTVSQLVNTGLVQTEKSNDARSLQTMADRFTTIENVLAEQGRAPFRNHKILQNEKDTSGTLLFFGGTLVFANGDVTYIRLSSLSLRNSLTVEDAILYANDFEDLRITTDSEIAGLPGDRKVQIAIGQLKALSSQARRAEALFPVVNAKQDSRETDLKTLFAKNTGFTLRIDRFLSNEINSVFVDLNDMDKFEFIMENGNYKFRSAGTENEGFWSHENNELPGNLERLDSSGASTLSAIDRDVRIFSLLDALDRFDSNNNAGVQRFTRQRGAFYLITVRFNDQSVLMTSSAQVSSLKLNSGKVILVNLSGEDLTNGFASISELREQFSEDKIANIGNVLHSPAIHMNWFARWKEEMNVRLANVVDGLQNIQANGPLEVLTNPLRKLSMYSLTAKQLSQMDDGELELLAKKFVAIHLETGETLAEINRPVIYLDAYNVLSLVKGSNVKYEELIRLEKGSKPVDIIKVLPSSKFEKSDVAPVFLVNVHTDVSAAKTLAQALTDQSRGHLTLYFATEEAFDPLRIR
jgi:hypothetical protein